MKFYHLLFLVFSFSSVRGQLKVNDSNQKTTIGAVKRSNNLIAELYYVVSVKGDTTYAITYNNYEYKIESDFKTVRFKGTTRTIDSLYNLMKAVFKPANKKNKEYSVSIKLGEDSARIGLTRVVGVTRLAFYGKEGYVYLTEKEVKKLFGKKD